MTPLPPHLTVEHPSEEEDVLGLWVVLPGARSRDVQSPEDPVASAGSLACSCSGS